MQNLGEYHQGNDKAALEYLHKAAALGHVVANIDLTEYMEDGPEKDAILNAYAEITPYAEFQRLKDIVHYRDFGYIAEMIKNAHEYINLIDYIFSYISLEASVSEEPHAEYIDGYLEELWSYLPDALDYVCEAYYRGCIEFTRWEFTCRNWD